MAWQPTVYSLLGVVAAGMSALVAHQAWRHRDQRGARTFVALMAVLGGWSLVYAVQLGFPTRAGQLFWQRLGLAIGGTIPALWLLFALSYAGMDGWLTRRRQALLAVDAIAFAALTLTNPAHSLIWDGARLVQTGGGPAVVLSLAAGYYLHIAYAYLLIAAGLGVLGFVFVRASPIYRKQTGLLILGTVPPFAGNVAFTLRIPVGPLPAIDPTPFAFVITGVLFGLALFQFDLLERAPIARRRVLSEMGDGLVVLDADGTVVDANPVARRVLDPPPAVGRPVADIDPGHAETAGDALASLDGRTLTATVDGRERAYDVDWSTLTDHRNETIGQILALRDVTDRNEYEQRLEIAQRVLRHNLRNDVNAILNWADYIAETDGDQTAAARRIVDTAEDVIDLSEKMRTLVRLEELATAERTAVDAGDRLAALVAEFRDAHPDATIESEIPATTVDLPSEEFLVVPVRNLIENAIEHNDAADPWVRVSVGASPDGVRVRVADDGPPIPAMEREVLEEGTEEPLRHGSGVGLWLAYRTVRSVGGDLAFDDREPRGNVVTLEFPAVDRSPVD